MPAEYRYPLSRNEISESRKRMQIFSTIESFADASPKPIDILIEKDGFPRAAAFFDIDKTLAHFGHIHGAAVRELYKSFVEPNVDLDDLEAEYLKGLGLGTTYRVFDRVNKIFLDGEEKFRDPQEYLTWLEQGDNKTQVDLVGTAHDLAAQYSFTHSQMGARIVEELYAKDTQSFEDTKIRPVFHLAQLYKRLGIPMVVMTANDEPFARSISKCLKLGELFIHMVHQRDFQGGKDAAMNALIQKLEAQGVPVPKSPKPLVVVGDSLNGDMGSGASFMETHPEYLVSGVLVCEDTLLQNQAAIQKESRFANMHMEVLDVNLVKSGASGVPQLAKYRREHSTTKE